MPNLKEHPPALLLFFVNFMFSMVSLLKTNYIQMLAGNPSKECSLGTCRSQTKYVTEKLWAGPLRAYSCSPFVWNLGCMHTWLYTLIEMVTKSKAYSYTGGYSFKHGTIELNWKIFLVSIEVWTGDLLIRKEMTYQCATVLPYKNL